MCIPEIVSAVKIKNRSENSWTKNTVVRIQGYHEFSDSGTNNPTIALYWKYTAVTLPHSGDQI